MSGRSISASFPTIGGDAAPGQVRAELAPRVVQGLVEGAARRAEPLGEHVDRHAVQRERDEHLPLMRGQHLVDGHPNGAKNLSLLRVLVRRVLLARETRPAFGLQGDLAALPGAPAQLHGGFEQRELVGPGREAAGAAEVVEAPEHASSARRRRPGGDVVELVAAQVRQGGVAAIGPRSGQREAAATPSSGTTASSWSAPSPRRSRSQRRDSGSRRAIIGGSATRRDRTVGGAPPTIGLVEVGCTPRPGSGGRA